MTVIWTRLRDENVLTRYSSSSRNSYVPVYIIKIIEKGEVNEEIKDLYGHSMAPGKLLLRGSYLKPERSRNISRNI